VKFKLDENLPVELARASNRILLTLDKGIANMLRYPLTKHAGVVLFRPDSSGQRAVLSFVRARLHDVLQMELADRLTVVGPTRIRIR